MHPVIAWQVPGEILCVECAAARWGAAIYDADFDAPEYPDETAVLYSWNVDTADSCTECGHNLFTQAGVYVPHYDGTHYDDEE